jgi:hypothetical protein
LATACFKLYSKRRKTTTPESKSPFRSILIPPPIR